MSGRGEGVVEETGLLGGGPQWHQLGVPGTGERLRKGHVQHGGSRVQRKPENRGVS